jgi:anti-sigma B factor antagonist
VIRPENSGRPHIEGSGTPSFQEQTPLFDLRVRRADSLTWVELLGELDLSGQDRFAAAVDTVQSGRLVLDLSGLTFIDSTGIRMILRTWQRSHEDGFVLEIVGGRDQVERVFRITGLDGALPMVDQISTNGDSQHSSNH